MHRSHFAAISVQDLKVHCLRALAAFVRLGFKRHLLALVQGTEPGPLDRADMHEYVGTALIGRDKAIALFGIEEFHHAVLAWSTIGSRGTRRARTKSTFLTTETAAFFTERPAWSKPAIVGRRCAEAAAAKISPWRSCSAAAKPPAVTAAEPAAITTAKAAPITAAEPAAITTAEAAPITAAKTATIATAEAALVTPEPAALAAAATAAEPTILHSQSLSAGSHP